MESNNELKYQRAKEKVEELKGFYNNLLAYCFVIPILAYINYQTSSFIWVIFPALGWGFGLLMHWMHVTGFNPILGKDWEQRKIQEFMNSDKF